ncbi:hypothetical protein LINPERPRIM_LOCUS38471 [Linum perenne]
MNLGVFSITRAEIRGAQEGIRCSWMAGFQKIEVQLDSQPAVAILMNEDFAISHSHVLEVMEFQEWTR